MILTQKQIAALWIAEGGPPDRAWEWSAIIMGESNGDTNAHEGGNPNSCCHGLAQLNVEVGNATMKCAMNPICATRTSIKLSDRGRDFTPWGAYTNGSYQRYLSQPVGFNPSDALKYVSPLYRLFKGEAPLPKFPGEGLWKDGLSGKGPVGDILKTDANALGIDLSPFFAVPAFFKGLGELTLTSEGWVRLAKLGGGLILILWGLRVIVKQSTGTDPIATAKKAGEAVGAAVVAKKLPVP